MSAESSNPLNSVNSAGSSAGSSVSGEKECWHCGTMMPTSAMYCPACGWSMVPLAAEDRAMAAAAYLTWVAGAVLLLLPKFRRREFIRFHAWQSVLLWGAFSVLCIVGILLSNVASAMVLLLVGILATLAMAFLWVVLTIKAWQGDRFGVPVIGEIAGRMPGVR